MLFQSEVPSCDITNPLVIHHKARRWSHWQSKWQQQKEVLKGIPSFDNSPKGVPAIWPKGIREKNLNPSQHSKLPMCFKSLAPALRTKPEQLCQPSLKAALLTQCWKKVLQYYMLPNTYTSQSLTYLPEKACQQGYSTRKTTSELLPDALVTYKC